MKRMIPTPVILFLVCSITGSVFGQVFQKELTTPTSVPTPQIQQRVLPGPEAGSAYADPRAVDGTIQNSGSESKVIPVRRAAPSSLSKRTSALSPDGVNEYGQFGVNGIITLTGSVSQYVAIPFPYAETYDGSMEMWIYPQTLGGTHELISKGKTDSCEYILGTTGNHLFFRMKRAVSIDAGDTLRLGQWNHVAVTWTGGSPFYVNFYIDGKHSGVQDTLYTPFMITSDSIHVGGPSNPYWSSEYFTGSIDAFRFWNQARTQADIAANRFVGLGGKDSSNANGALQYSQSYSGLEGSWNFDEGGTFARDFVSGFNGTYVGCYAYAATEGVPMPYNQVLYLPGNDSAYVTIPHNNLMNQNVDGSLELWFFPAAVTREQVILGKGNTSAQTFLLGQRADSSLFFRMGSTIFSDSVKVPANRWNHVAVSWLFSGSNVTVTFCTNGRQTSVRTLAAAFVLNTDPLTVGNSIMWSGEYFNGYVDELRIWGNARSAAEVKKYMFTSGRLLTSNPNLVACWQFEGDMVNITSNAGMNGTFNNGKGNAARFSGLRNETSSGSYYTLSPRAHSTVMNWMYAGGTSPFPLSFVMDVPFADIPDNLVTGLTRPMAVASSLTTVTSVQLFLDIEHTWMGDLAVTLTSPNSQVRQIVTNVGGAADNVLSFFGDNLANTVSTTYLPPYGFAKPTDVFSTFNSSPVNGTWTLKIVDNAAGDAGILKAWGLRFNNQLVGVKEQGQLPLAFHLEQNYPNPFNPTTCVSFQLPAAGHVHLVLYDLLGREVKTLVNSAMDAGLHKVQVDGSSLSTGVYLYRLEANGSVAVKKMILLK